MQILKLGILIAIMTIADLTASSKQILKKDEVWVCVRWKWAGSPGQSQVLCVEWAKKDCSNRLYPEICRKGG